MSKTQEWFGIDVSSPLSLKYRAYAELVRRLVSVPVHVDEHNRNLYHFKRLPIRITEVRAADDYEYVVEIFDPHNSKEVLIKETVSWAGFPSTLGYHPFCELIELVQGKHRESVATVYTINHILEDLGAE